SPCRFGSMRNPAENARGAADRSAAPLALETRRASHAPCRPGALVRARTCGKTAHGKRMPACACTRSLVMRQVLVLHASAERAVDDHVVDEHERQAHACDDG